MASATRTYRTLLETGDNYPVPVPTIAGLHTLMNTNNNGPDTRRLLTEYAEISPCVIAVNFQDSPGVVSILHSPRVYRLPGPDQGKLVWLYGNAEDAVIPIILPDEAYSTQANAQSRPLDVVENQVVTGGAVSGAVLNGEADIVNVTLKKFVVLPVSHGPAMVAAVNLPYKTFYQQMLEPTLQEGDAAKVQSLLPYTQFFQVSATPTDGANAHPMISVTNDLTEAHRTRAISVWMQRFVIPNDMLKVGAARRAQTDAAVSDAIKDLKTSLEDQEDARIQAESQKQLCSFTEKFGPDIAMSVHKILEVDDDSGLPDVHTALARCKTSSRESYILQAALCNAMGNSPLPISEANMPLVTKHWLELFRNHQILSMGTTLGQGITIFAVVCQGHPGANEARKRLQDSNTVEGGGSTTLDDARALSVSDARLAVTLTYGVDKAYGFSLWSDTYFGRNHCLARALRSGALKLGIALPALASYYGNPGAAVRMCNRVMFKYQQLTFSWIRKRRDTPVGTAVPVPDFDSLAHEVSSFLLSGMPELPHAWNSLILDENTTSDRPSGGGGASEMRIRGGAPSTEEDNRPHPNPGLDSTLRARWNNSGYQMMNQMTANFRKDDGTTWQENVPKSRGSEVCLKWHGAGKCKRGCQRKSTHFHAGPQLVTDMMAFFDLCGMPQA